ncbi:hypothetical protein ES703_20796 [subsurface metagenome]
MDIKQIAAILLQHSQIAARGTTTDDGAGAGTSFIDTTLIGVGAGSFVSMLAVLYPGQPTKVDSVAITGFATLTGEVTLASAYKGVAAPIPAGVPYMIVTFRFVAADVAALTASVGDASASALGSLYAILGNPPYAIEHSIRHIPKYTGNIWFVDGTNGNDANTGIDPHDAFKTIAHAIGAAAAGDRIVVMAGAYDEVLNMNLAGLELICEQGTVLSNSTPGTALIVSANYCRVVGPFLTQAGQTGCQITGSFCSLEVCLAFGCATGFDDDGAETHFTDCRSILHTTTGFDISAGYGQYERLVAASTGAVRGIYLSNAAANNNHFHKCDTLGNGTAGWELIVGADNNLCSHCSMGAGDGARVDAGANNTWNNFSEGSQILAGQTRDQDLKDIYDATQIRRVASGTSGAIGTGASKYIEIDSGTNAAEILAVIINGVVGFDWTLDVYVPTADAVNTPAAGDMRDSIAYVSTDSEGGLLKPFGIAYNAFLKFTNDNVGDQTITDVVVVYRSRGAITIGAWT